GVVNNLNAGCTCRAGSVSMTVYRSADESQNMQKEEKRDVGTVDSGWTCRNGAYRRADGSRLVHLGLPPPDFGAWRAGQIASVERSPRRAIPYRERCVSSEIHGTSCRLMCGSEHLAPLDAVNTWSCHPSLVVDKKNMLSALSNCAVFFWLGERRQVCASERKR